MAQGTIIRHRDGRTTTVVTGDNGTTVVVTDGRGRAQIGSGRTHAEVVAMFREVGDRIRQVRVTEFER